MGKELLDHHNHQNNNHQHHYSQRSRSQSQQQQQQQQQQQIVHKRTNKSELDKLLSDEGTVKLLLNNTGLNNSSSSNHTLIDSASVKSIEEVKRNVLRRANNEDSKDESGARVSLRGATRKVSAEAAATSEASSSSKDKDGLPPANKRRRSSLIGSLKGAEVKHEANHQKAASTGSTSKEVNNHLPAIITSRILNTTILHIVLSFPSPTNCKLTTEMLTNLCKVIENVNSEPTIHSILVTSTGSSFCNGLEYDLLMVEKVEGRKKKATAMMHALKALLHTLKTTKKNLIVGVQSDVSNFGILLLSYFDYVYISDKVNFFTDYYLYNTIPELFFPHWSRDSVITSMLTTKRHLTAEQLHSTSIGLITEILWPSKFNEELIKRLIMISSCNNKAREKTRLLISSSRDNALLPEQELLGFWTSDNFQAQIAKIKEKRL